MIKELLFKPFVALAIKWRRDEFFAARLKLTAAYTMTAGALLGVFSYLLYGTLLKEIGDSFEGNFSTEVAQQLAFQRVADALQARILFADTIVLTIVIIFGFIMTKLALRPIKKALDSQRRFVADAAHELRTPLAVMKTEIEVALRGEENFSLSAKKIMSSTLEEIDDLTLLSNDLLEIAKGQINKGQAVHLSITKLVRQTTERLRSLAEEKHIIIKDTVREEFFTEGNPAALERAFYNVIHNAITYTPDGGNIDISIHKHRSIVDITVADSGIGISPEHITHIFDPFYCADPSRTFGGSRLGLAIIKATIEQCGGHVAIESTLGKGTRVIISLPLAI